MPTLSSRLKAMAKRVATLEQGSPDALAALLRLEAALTDIEALLPARQRGRPKQREIVLHLLRFYVDGMKTLGQGVKTDRDALHLFLRSHKGRGNLKTLQNQLARGRRLTR